MMLTFHEILYIIKVKILKSIKIYEEKRIIILILILTEMV